jgi:CRISPR-associated protein Cmr4
MTYLAHKLVGMMAQTAIHAGASSNENLIDLPIQREAHSDWPVVVGSGVKGAWRAKAEVEVKQQPEVLTAIFGPDTHNASDHAGAIMVSDARLLLLPVRSLTSHFKWVTCPALLTRFARDKQRLGFGGDIHQFSVGKETALVLTEQAEDLHLEEYRFKTQQIENEALIHELISVMGDSYQDELLKNLTIISDDQFRYFCRAAIPVQAHIAIESQTKTVKPGALWYEETLPAETLMYNCLTFSDDRSQGKMSAEDLAECFSNELIVTSPYLQVGGNATVGMGWFALTVATK